MSEEINKIPLPSDADVMAQQMQMLRPYLLDPREDYPEPYHILEFNGVPFAKVGGLAAISGQKKNGKSFVLTQLMSAILGNGSERIQQYLPGLTVPKRTIDYIGHEPKVLYVDTEMEKLSSAKVLRRVHWLCGWDMKMPNDRFAVLWLKNMPKDSDKKAHLQRYDMIRLAVDVIKPDVMFIDGLRDLMASINDEDSIVDILDYFGNVAEDRNMNIWMALHQNPSRKNDDDEVKMRGWAGTELGNKVSDTLVSIKNKTASGVTFTVKQQDARDKDLEDWKFQVTGDAGNLGIPKIISNGSGDNTATERSVGDSMEDVERWFNEAKDKVEWPATRKTVKEVIIRDHGQQTNKTKQDIDLQMLLNKRILVNASVKQNGYWMLIPNEEVLGDPLPEPPNTGSPF